PLTINEPNYDNFAFFCFLAGRTRHLRFGTAIYQAALRHPFVLVRAIQTLDILSKGRCEIGVGAGWVRSEYEAAGVDWRTRGRRRRGGFRASAGVRGPRGWPCSGGVFSPPPPVVLPQGQPPPPPPPIHAGGTGMPSLRRAARLDGWIGRDYTTETVQYYVDT